MFMSPFRTGITLIEEACPINSIGGVVRGVAKLYSSGSFILTLFIITYLLLALIVCVRVVGAPRGPLRKFR
jgi:hypothetical protein